MSEGTGQPQRYCRNCGAEVREGTQYCVSCGASLVREPSSSDEVHSVPPPPTPSRSLVDTLREAMLGLTQRFSNASSSSSGGTTTHGIPGTIINWFKDLPSTPKLTLVGLVLLLILTVLSPLALVAAALVVVVSVIAFIIRMTQRGSVKGWGIVAVASIALMLVFGAISNEIYGIFNDPEEKLYGEWTGYYEGEAVSLTFLSGGTVLGKSGNDSESGTYRVDMDEEPAHLDIESDNGREVKTIIEFIDDDHMRFEDNQSGKVRPTSFGKNSSTVLTREEDSR